MKKNSKKKTNRRGRKKEVEKSVEKIGQKTGQSVLKKDDKDKIVYAREKYIQMSARKARLIIDLVRGEDALEAVSKLVFVRKRGALIIKKVIESAIANAVNNFEMDKDKLIIAEAFVNDAPIFKRWRAGSRGRYKKILKRNCHIVIGLKAK